MAPPVWASVLQCGTQRRGNCTDNVLAFSGLVVAVSEDTSPGGGVRGMVVEGFSAGLVRAEGGQVGRDLCRKRVI